MAGRKIKKRIKPHSKVGIAVRLLCGLVLLGLSFLLLVFMCLWVTLGSGFDPRWGAAIALVLIFGPLLALGIYCTWQAIQGFRAMRALVDRSACADTVGQVVERYAKEEKGSYGRHKYYTYYIVVQFDAGEEQVNLRVELPGALYRTMHEGRSLRIRYARLNPRFALLEGEIK